jgi:RecA-family ATPase
VLPLGKVGQIVAEGGAGKTMVLAQLAVAVATGTPWLGALDVASPGRVFLALGEEDADEVHRRLFNAVRSSRAANPQPGSIVVLPLAGVACAMLEADDRGNAIEAPFLPWLRSHLAASPDWRLVVVDPLSRFAGPDAEIDNAAATRFVQALESIAGATGATTLAAHHTTKASRARGATVDGTAGRGSSALFDGTRWQCSLAAERLELADSDTRERLGEVVTFTVSKSNYGRKPDPIMLRRDLDNGGALVPLDEADLETTKNARGRDPARETKRAAKDAELGEREAAEDAAVDRAVNARPGIPTRDLVAAVRAATRCGGDRAMVAVARAADRLDVREGPRKARLHYPRTARP